MSLDDNCIYLASPIDDKQIITNGAAPILGPLAETVHGMAQLGTLENDMVTYRIKAGQGAFPVMKPDGSVPAAISVSRFHPASSRIEDKSALQSLRNAAGRIQKAAFSADDA